MEIALSPPLHVFKCKETGLRDQVFQRTEELPVKVGEIVEEMGDEMPESFLRMKILLSAILTIFSLYFGSAIEAVGFASLRQMGQF